MVLLSSLNGCNFFVRHPFGMQKCALESPCSETFISGLTFFQLLLSSGIYPLKGLAHLAPTSDFFFDKKKNHFLKMIVLGHQEELRTQISSGNKSRPVFSFLITITITLRPLPPSNSLNIYPFQANQRVNDIFSDTFQDISSLHWEYGEGEFKNHKY